MTEGPRPKIAVLLAVYNGAENLAAQLESYAAQTLPPDFLIVSDDGSTDASLTLIDRFAASHPGITVQKVSGPQQGSAANFLSLIRRVPEEVDQIAFSDQDDVWLPEKLARGQAALSAVPAHEPALYCGRTWECRADLSQRTLSRLPRRSPGFRNALVQNIAAGNTIHLNRPAFELVRAASSEAQRVVVHDWWLYQMITGVGGKVIFDPEPLLLYRQHKGNQIGANRGWHARARRLRMMWNGRLRDWNTVNIRALRASEARLLPEFAKLLHAFQDGRQSPLRLISLIARENLYRQGRAGQASLYLAALFGKL